MATEADSRFRTGVSVLHLSHLVALDGGSLSEAEIVAEAYEHVAEGYRRALTVRGLPQVEVESLTASLRVSRSVAGLPPLEALPASGCDRGRSQLSG